MPKIIQGRFSFLVIGKGLMGSAAARYLSAHSPDVALIGPDEPVDYARHDGVFSSHYDEGRITQRLARDMVWSQLAERAIGQYPLLEAASGLLFHTPCGVLTVTHAPGESRYVGQRGEIAAALKAAYEIYPDAAAIRQAHPLFQFTGQAQGSFEPAPAGYINPRTMIRAQLHLARQQGATIVNDEVIQLCRATDHVTVTTRNGQTYQAEKVLLAAGAFVNGYDLLTRPLVVRVKSETIILARLAAADIARLSQMPALIYEIPSPVLADIYLLPPIPYPDGHTYLKMGCNTASDQTLSDMEAMRHWMIQGDSDLHKAEMQAALSDLIPTLRPLSWQTKRCLVTYTAHGKPYIDQLDDHVFVAAGGNGTSAKSADTSGYLGAQLLLEQPWPAPFERATFQAVIRSED